MLKNSRMYVETKTFAINDNNPLLMTSYSLHTWHLTDPPPKLLLYATLKLSASPVKGNLTPVSFDSGILCVFGVNFCSYSNI